MEELRPEHIRLVLDRTFTRLIEALGSSKEPWLRSYDPYAIPGAESQFDWHDPDGSKRLTRQIRANAAKRAIAEGDVSRWSAFAVEELKGLGVDPDDESPLFEDLCIELAKLECLELDAEQARSEGDFSKEDEYIKYFQRNGYRIIPSARSRTGSGPRLSEAWKEYYEEKTSGVPEPAWKHKTAKGQQATFDEFLELVTDLRVAQLDRGIMQAYIQRVSRLPKNRRKLYGDTPAFELLKLDLTASQLPSSRTVAEKLVHIGSFLKWCRLIKRYSDTDPTEGLSVRAKSRSYAPFNQTDLKALFENQEYTEGGHKKLWHFWVPLIALYTGARQTEIGQLLVENIVEEDGVWVLIVTDTGEGQRVKTQAGIRKVPINSILQRIGLVEYAMQLREMGEERLFPDLTQGPFGWGQKISRWFNDTYKKKCGVSADPTGGRKVFHSFRHTAITKAVGAGLPIQHCQQVFGHEKSSLGETATYTSQFPVETLVPVVDTLDFGLVHSQADSGWRRLLSSFS